MLSSVNDGLLSVRANEKLNSFINALIVCIAVTLIFEIIFTINYSGVYVVGRSMNDTLAGAVEVTVGEYKIADVSGDYLYVRKNVKADYGDIVVVLKDDKTTIIKRVIAKGGDYVKIVNGKVFIRHSSEESFPEEPLVENYVSPSNNSPERNNFYDGNDEGFYVKDGCYFLLGDNRNESLDSREKGGICFTQKQIYGVVTDWSLERKSTYTKLHKFFAFDLPDFFGIDNRVKRLKLDEEV